MYEIFKDKMRAEALLRHRLEFSEDSESDCDSISSMKESRKKVHFTDSGIENLPEVSKDTKKMASVKRVRKAPNFKLLQLNRGDIPDGSDVFRQVLKEIKSLDDNGDSDPTSEHTNRSTSPPGKSILKKK